MPDFAAGLLLSALDLIAHELILFAAFWFLLGALDDLVVDVLWLVARIRRKIPNTVRVLDFGARFHSPQFAVFVPAWREADVIGEMVRHCLSRWPGREYRLFIGTYIGDPDTAEAAREAAAGDPRVHVHVHDRAGPSSKADCLNALWQAMITLEQQGHPRFSAIVLQDAEDVVHPDALAVFRHYLPGAALVQLPVLPLIDPQSRWVGGHYADEFAEMHGKELVLRSWLNAGIPAAGVGCAFGRRWLDRLAARPEAGEQGGPFAADSFTEDYETALRIHMLGGRGVFARERNERGDLVATHAYFPDMLDAAVRQKSRWVMGIALAGWDRLGWGRSLSGGWMRLRDRRSVLASLVLLCGYSGALLALLAKGVGLALPYRAASLGPGLVTLVQINMGFLVWRIMMRAGFTTAHYGLAQGLLSVPRIFISNLIAIAAARRAVTDYVRSLRGTAVPWDKTEHRIPPYEPGAER